MTYSDVIYRDIDDDGYCFTVYENGACIGSFLDDDAELSVYRDRGYPQVDGLDNRTK